MNKFILNEEIEATSLVEEIRNNIKKIKNKEMKRKSLKRSGSNVKKNIILLIKYLHKQKVNKPNIIRKLDSVMKDIYSDYYTANWINFFSNYVKKYTKKDYCEYRKVDNIEIKKSELKIIEELKNEELESLAFVMLVYSKYNNKLNHNDNYWVNQSDTLIYKESQLKGSVRKKDGLTYQLKEKGLIFTSQSNLSDNSKILFANDKDNDVIIILYTLKNCLLEYKKYKGNNNIKYCEECGCPIELKNNKTKYCEECKIEKDKETKLKYWNKNKDKYRD